MKVFLDTNVLIAASVRQHPHFLRADAVLQKCMTGEEEGIIHSHSIFEFHSAITRLPGGLAVPPIHVHTLLQEGLLPYLRCISLDFQEIQAVQKTAGEQGLSGGIIYDLYHLFVAEKESVERLYTFNTGHFQLIATSGMKEMITSP